MRYKLQRLGAFAGLLCLAGCGVYIRVIPNDRMASLPSVSKDQIRIFTIEDLSERIKQYLKNPEGAELRLVDEVVTRGDGYEYVRLGQESTLDRYRVVAILRGREKIGSNFLLAKHDSVLSRNAYLPYFVKKAARLGANVVLIHNRVPRAEWVRLPPGEFIRDAMAIYVSD